MKKLGFMERLKVTAGLLLFSLLIVFLWLEIARDKEQREYIGRLEDKVEVLGARTRACELAELKAWARKVSKEGLR